MPIEFQAPYMRNCRRDEGTGRQTNKHSHNQFYSTDSNTHRYYWHKSTRYMKLLVRGITQDGRKKVGWTAKCQCPLGLHLVLDRPQREMMDLWVLGRLRGAEGWGATEKPTSVLRKLIQKNLLAHLSCITSSLHKLKQCKDVATKEQATIAMQRYTFLCFTYY